MPDLTQDTIDQIKAMRADGVSWKAIQATFHIAYDKARGALEPEYYEARKIRNSNRKREESSGSFHDPRDRTGIKLADIEKRRKWQQRRDTRDLTSIIMGDPFPGRSALDRKKEGRAQS